MELAARVGPMESNLWPTHRDKKRKKFILCRDKRVSLADSFPFAVVQKFGSLGAKKIAFSTQKAVVGLFLPPPKGIGEQGRDSDRMHLLLFPLL